MNTKKLIGKRQIVLAALILTLSAAIFLNWQYSDEGNNTLSALSGQSGKNLGDAKLVNAPATNNTTAPAPDGFFEKSRTDRSKARAEAVAQLKEIANDVKSDAKTKNDALAKMQALIGNSEKENSIETLIKAKKFADCVAIINDDKINIIVKTETLNSSQVLQIQDIVTDQIKISSENIKIIEVK